MEGGAFDVTVTIDLNEWEDDISDDVTATRHNAVVFVLFVVVLPLVSLLVKSGSTARVADGGGDPPTCADPPLPLAAHTMTDRSPAHVISAPQIN